MSVACLHLGYFAVEERPTVLSDAQKYATRLVKERPVSYHGWLLKGIAEENIADFLKRPEKYRDAVESYQQANTTTLATSPVALFELGESNASGV